MTNKIHTFGMSFSFILTFLFLAVSANAAAIGASVDKTFVTEPLYFHYNDSAREFSTEILNSGSLPYIAQLRADVIDKNKTIFTAWSERKKLMPGNNGFFILHWLPEMPGNYTTRYRIYYSGEISEMFANITVDNIRAAEDMFNITLYRSFDNFLVLEVKSSVSAKATIIPYDYPQGWWVAQRTVELKPGTARIIVPYGPLEDGQVKFAVVSEDGKYASRATLNLERKKTDIVRLLFKLLA